MRAKTAMATTPPTTVDTCCSTYHHGHPGYTSWDRAGMCRAAHPPRGATPSNQGGRQTFSGRTAAACDGKVAGMPATLAATCGALVEKVSELLELLRHQLVRRSEVDLVALLPHGHHEHHVALDPDADHAHVPLGVLLRVGERLGTRYADHRAGVARRVAGAGGVEVVPEETVRVVGRVELVQPDVHHVEAAGGDPALHRAVAEVVLVEHVLAGLRVAAQLGRLVQREVPVGAQRLGPVARPARRVDQEGPQVSAVRGAGARGGRGGRAGRRRRAAGGTAGG